jgi:hypothetical protein
MTQNLEAVAIGCLHQRTHVCAIPSRSHIIRRNGRDIDDSLYSLVYFTFHDTNIILTFHPLLRIPSNCAFTAQHSNPEAAQKNGGPATSGLSLLNSGILVINPSLVTYDSIISRLQTPSSTSTYQFPDQSLLADLFPARWVVLPYIYNALKTLRWEGVHRQIWRDDEVKNIHYILNPKPWSESAEERIKSDNETRDPLHQLWWDANDERQKRERVIGIADGF